MNILLRDVPDEIKKIIDEQQKNEKEKRQINQLSQSSIIFKIIREWSQKK